jgi:hypothetical protein
VSVAMARTSTKRRPYDATENLQTFVSQRNKIGKRQKKPKLTPEDYEADIQKLNGSGPLAPKDADATKENISGICRKWKR